MIERAYIHVAGPEGSGKTTLVEAILGAFDGPAVTVRCRRDDDVDESVESSPARDAELRRYREAGASGVARFAFPAETDVRERDDRAAAERMLDDIGRLRDDDDVRAAVLGRFAHRTKVTAVVADLSDPEDAGTKNALARIKRALAQRGRP